MNISEAPQFSRESLNSPLRLALGILGLSLPWMLFLGSQLAGWQGLRPSISEYFFTNVRDLFVGYLYAFGLFLITYRGYEGDADDLLSTLAGIAAILVGFFPSLWGQSPTFQRLVPFLNADVTSIIHYTAAIGFFLILFVLSTFFFTRSQDVKRNKIYRFCGWTIFAALAALGLFILLPRETQIFLDQFSLFFLLETVALSAFGLSWLVKSGVTVPSGS